MLLLRRSLSARRLIALLLATAVVVAACSGDDDGGDGQQQSGPSTSSTTAVSTTVADGATSTTTEATTTTAVPGTGTISVFDLGVEDCFNAAAPSTEPSEVEEVERVACEEAHDSQVFAQTVFESADSAYPGEDDLIDYATRFCVDAFEPYVGLPYADSALTVSHFWPTATAWESTDDRTIHCVLFQKGGTSAASARDSGL
jgi:hypothetical protein